MGLHPVAGPGFVLRRRASGVVGCGRFGQVVAGIGRRRGDASDVGVGVASLGSFCAGVQGGARWRGLAGFGARWNRRQLDAEICGLRFHEKSPLTPALSHGRLRSSARDAKGGLGRGSRWLRAHDASVYGAVVRGCDDLSVEIAAFGPISRIFWGWRGLRFARRGRAPSEGLLIVVGSVTG
jgi:hypothetical protein